MALFTGTYENKVDQKGRVSLPADFRDLLSEDSDSRSFYIFPSPNLDCLEACDKAFIQRIAESIEDQVDLFSDEEDELSQIIAEARRIQYDSTGRFVLPGEFIDHAEIDNSAMFVSRVSRFQIWNPDMYRAHMAEVKKNKKTKGLKLKKSRGADE